MESLVSLDFPIVLLDEPIEIKNFILNGELFILRTTELRESALAWYQGHLHVFHKLIGTSSWYLTSKIGHELQNGILISELILENQPDIVSFKAQLLALQPQSPTISSNRESRLRKIFLGKSKHAPQIKGPRVMISRLAATSAAGFLCGDIGLEEYKNTVRN